MKLGCGLYWSIFLASSSALVHRMTNLSRSMIAFDDLGHVAVEQGLAAGDGDGGRAAFVDRVHALLHRTGAGSGSHRDNRSCRSRRRPGCSGTAAPASAPADISRRRDASSSHRRRSWRPGAAEVPCLSPQFGRQAELDMFLLAVHLFHFDVFDFAQRRRSHAHQFFRARWRRRSGRPPPCRAPIRASARCRRRSDRRARLPRCRSRAGGWSWSCSSRPPPGSHRRPWPARAPRSGGSGWRSRCRWFPGPTMSLKRFFSATMMPLVSSIESVVWVI